MGLRETYDRPCHQNRQKPVMQTDQRNYLIITCCYWVFTLTDGAIRMLVVLYFHRLGYSPFEVAMLFLFYEFFGIVTNLIGGWLATRMGLNLTMHIGMALQIVALLMLAVPESWLAVAYVMFAQALSGIAKDLNKMSAKTGVKMLVNVKNDSRLFSWVTMLTGSKNALKGVGFFLGSALLEFVGFQNAMFTLAGALLAALISSMLHLPRGLGKIETQPKFLRIFSNTPSIKGLSLARFFLFGARDIWFVVGLPLFLFSTLDWHFSRVGAFLALWLIVYGIIQSSAPLFLKKNHHGRGPSGKTAQLWAGILVLIPASIALALQQGLEANRVIIVGLILFGAVFAINSAVHSYLVVAWSEPDKVAMNLGFYYMANAGGRLTGTVLSGWIYQTQGLVACLWGSTVFVLIAALIPLRAPRKTQG